MQTHLSYCTTFVLKQTIPSRCSLLSRSKLGPANIQGVVAQFGLLAVLSCLSGSSIKQHTMTYLFKIEEVNLITKS